VTAATKLAAMILKAMYLEGHPVDKALYRTLALRGEKAIAVPGVSASSEVAHAVLRAFPTESWRKARAANFSVLASLIDDVDWARVLRPAENAGRAFSCVLILDTADLRERVRARLIEANIFPAVLWPLDETVLTIGDEVRNLSRRLLSIHCDGRYGVEDMRHVGEVLTRNHGP
jgi:hypothetical protein